MFELPYELVVGVHVAAFFINIALVVVSDIQGLLWLTGKLHVLPHRRMVLLHRLIGVGLTISILTGAWLFASVSEYLLTVPAFYTKTLFVLALAVNAFIIGKHLHIASSLPFREITAKEKRNLFLSGTVSTISWIGAFVSAQFLGL